MRWFTLGLLVTLVGCAGTPPTPADQVLYKGPDIQHFSFDLDINPAADGSYLIDGKSATLKDIYWRIRDSRHTDKAINSVLYHTDGGNMTQYMCVISIIYDWRIAGYQETSGVTRPIKVTGDSQGFQIFYNQCMDSIGAR